MRISSLIANGSLTREFSLPRHLLPGAPSSGATMIADDNLRCSLQRITIGSVVNAALPSAGAKALELITAARTSLELGRPNLRAVPSETIRGALRASRISKLNVEKRIESILGEIIRSLARGVPVGPWLESRSLNKTDFDTIMKCLRDTEKDRALLDAVIDAAAKNNVTVTVFLPHNATSSDAMTLLYLRAGLATRGKSEKLIRVYRGDVPSAYIVQDGRKVWLGDQSGFIKTPDDAAIVIDDKHVAQRLREQHLARIAYETERPRAPHPHMRLFMGYRDPSTSPKDFIRGLHVLMPDTLLVGASRGLIGYLPFVLNWSKKIPQNILKQLPHEMALVVYDDVETYDAIRATLGGEAYGKEHFELPPDVETLPGMAGMGGKKLFARDIGDGRKSGSALANPFIIPGDNSDLAPPIVFGQVYSLFADRNVDWQSGVVGVRISARRPHISDDEYKDFITHYMQLSQETTAAVAHVVRVEKDFILEYIIAKNTEEYELTMFKLDESSEHGEPDPDVPVRVLQVSKLGRLEMLESEQRDFPLTHEDGSGRGYQFAFPTTITSPFAADNDGDGVPEPLIGD